MRTLGIPLSDSRQTPVHLLVVSPNCNDSLGLKALIRDARWKHHQAESIAGAAKEIAQNDIGVVIVGDELPDGNWLTLLESLRPLPNPPRVVVFSPCADDELWIDVLTKGGFDVLASPLERNDVLRVLQTAWCAWSRSQQAEEPRKPSSQVVYRPSFITQSA